MQALARTVLDGERVLIEVRSCPDAIGMVEVDHLGERHYVHRERIKPESDLARLLLESGDRFVAQDALRQYRKNAPSAGVEDLVAAIARGVSLEREMVDYLAGRHSKAKRPHKLQKMVTSPDSYILSPGRQGVFVIFQGHVVTYLRLGLLQQAFVRKHWPADGLPPLPETVVLPESPLPQRGSSKSLPNVPLIPDLDPPAPELIKDLGVLFQLKQVTQTHRIRIEEHVEPVRYGVYTVFVFEFFSGKVMLGQGRALKKRHAQAHAAQRALSTLARRGYTIPVRPTPGQVALAVRPAARSLVATATPAPSRDSLHHLFDRWLCRCSLPAITAVYMEVEREYRCRILSGDLVLSERRGSSKAIARANALQTAIGNVKDPVLGVEVRGVTPSRELCDRAGGIWRARVHLLLSAPMAQELPQQAIATRCVALDGKQVGVYYCRKQYQDKPEIQNQVYLTTEDVRLRPGERWVCE